MFGRKKKSVTEVPDSPRPRVVTIPADFYGGQNPVVTFKAVPQEIELGRASTPRSSRPAAPARSFWARFRLSRQFFTRPRNLISIGIVLFVVFAGGAAWYYLSAARRAARPPAPLAGVTAIVAPSTLPPAPTTPPTTTPAELPPALPLPPPAAEASLDIPSLFLGDSPDSDNDGLTNLEEELFETGEQTPDSDLDRYPDSHEVYNLYNPKGKEPEKLIESGLIKEYAHPGGGWQLFYPVEWAVGAVDNQGDEVLFSTFTGEYVAVRRVEKLPQESFADWLARAAPSERLDTLLEFKSVFGAEGQRRNDYLTYYWPQDSAVLVLWYHPAPGDVVNYRTVIKMMARSFRASAVAAPGSSLELPARPAPPPTPSELESGSGEKELTPVTNSPAAGGP